MAESTLDTLGRLCWPYKSLPPALSKAAREEAHADLLSVLEDLRKPDASLGLLGYTVRRLERLRDYGRQPVEVHVQIAIEIWRRVQSPDLGYRLRRHFAGRLHQCLRGLRKELCPARGLKPIGSQAMVEGGPLAPIAEAISWRDIQALLLQELERSRRGAPLEHSSHSQHFAESLAPLVNELRHWTDPSEAEAIVASLAPWMDPSQRSIILFGRLMLMSVPTSACPKFIEDGRLFEWWNMLPRNANARYSLMWIAVPARAAKLRWASGEPRSESPVLNSDRLSAFLDTLAGTMCLPIDEGKSCEMDHFADDCQWAFLGGTLYRLVAKFFVYSLEPLEKVGQAFPAGSTWAALELFFRRLRPCMINSGIWTLHVRTFVFEFTRGFYIRLCRERFREPGCAVHESCRLTPACDDAFVRLVAPLLVDTLSLQMSGGEQMHSIVTSLSFVTRVSLSNTPRFEEIKTFLQDSVEDLADPMSVRHSSTLQLLMGFTPFLVYAVPGLVVDAAHLALPGIDPTDTLKTLIAAAFFVNLFMQVPTLDFSTREMPDELPKVLHEALPVLTEASEGVEPVPSATPGELQMCTSTLPDLSRDLLERFLEYIQGVPKPSKRDGMAALDLAGPRLLATALFLCAKQGESSTTDAMIDRLADWLKTTLAPNAIKGVCMLVGAFSLAHQRASAKLMDVAISRLPLTDKGIAALGESEALWHMSILAAAARFGAVELLPRKDALEARIEAALKDERKPVRKAGAKLCRRVLMGLTAPFTGDLTGDGTVSEALHRWSGARSLSFGSPMRHVTFHEPTPEELEFAHSLCDKTLVKIKELASGSDEDIHTCLTLCKSVLRGVACLYPDERQEGTPTVNTLPNVLGPKVFTEIAEMLLALCPKLGKPHHPFEKEEANVSSRPKLLCKALRAIVGLVRGERRPEVPDMLQIRGFEGNVRARIMSESLSQKVHYMSAWRDVSRFWYNWEVLALLNRRLHSRPSGFKYEGVRQQLADLICSYALHENGLVSATAGECLQNYLRVHYSAKKGLQGNVFLRDQEKTIAGASKIGPEDNHLAEAALQGFAGTAARLFVSGAWRRSAAEALRFASIILRTIHAFTEEGACKADVRPTPINMQFELLSKWCTSQMASSPGSGAEACKVASELLELLKLPGIHWRTRVCVVAAVGSVLRVLHLTGAKDIDDKVLRQWLTEVLGSFSDDSPPQLGAMAVAELTAAMRSALKRPDSAVAAALKELLPASGPFLGQAAKRLAGLHQGHVGHDGAAAQADSVQCVVHAAAGGLGVPHLAWSPCPSGHAWTQHAAFFQTYVCYRHRRGDASLFQDLQEQLDRLQKQPKSEREEHILFVEILAGALRAARRWSEKDLDALWSALGPPASEEFRTAEEMSIRNWQFLTYYVISGVSRRLRLSGGDAVQSEDVSIRRFAAFLMAGGYSAREALLAPALTAVTAADEASSHAYVKKLRMTQVILAALRRRRPCISQGLRIELVNGVAPALKDGIAHPYKQVHEESAKSMVMAFLTDADTGVRDGLDEWITKRAEEVGQAVNAAPKDSTISVECHGIVYLFIHALLGRRMRSLCFRSASFLLSAASAEDHELRALAGLALGCLGQSPQREYEAVPLANALSEVCTVPEGTSDAQSARRLEAAAALVGACTLRHLFTMRLGGDGKGEGERLCRESLLRLLREKRIEVRVAGQSALAPLLGLESPEALKKRAKQFAALGKSAETVDEAVHGLGAMLKVAGSLGVPPWLGAVVESLAQVGRRPEAKKEVERIVQAFLKQQQQSRDLWKRCQSRLTEEQMELLKAGKGTLSYYS